MGRKTTRRSKYTPEPQNNVLEFHQEHAPTKRKRWSTHDLKSIRALNERQRDFLEGWFSGNSVCAAGSAGTGKSYLGVYAALTSLLDERDSIQKIIIVRSAVTTREIGHLPGTLEEKQAVFEAPYVDIFADLLGRDASYADMKDADKVEFMLTSHVRGLTWNNVVVVLDEAQNMTWEELDSVATRLGTDSRIILCGDTRHQQDLKRHEVSGLANAIRVMNEMSKVTMVQFTKEDIVRGGFVRSWIAIREDLNL